MKKICFNTCKFYLKFNRRDLFVNFFINKFAIRINRVVFAPRQAQRLY